MPWALHLASPHCSLLLLSFLRSQDILALSIWFTSVSRRYDQAMLHPLTWKYRVPLVCSEFFWDGFTVALLNPKTALFFAAYLPQFLPASKAPMAQTLVFGSIFVLIAATTDGVYAVAAGSLKPWLAKGRALGDFGHKLAGGIYIGLGLFTAFAGHRPSNSLRSDKLEL
jgi:threonine/homoserine/homoserine lactone efflux protein